MGLLLAVLSAWLIAYHAFLSALGIWYLSRLCDGTDGIWARAAGKTSAFGAYLDILCDMAAYSLMVLGFYFCMPELASSWLTILFLYVLCITSALALGAQEQKLGHDTRDNRGLRLGAGLAEAGETSIAYTLFLVFPEFIKTLATLWILALALCVLLRSVLAARLLRH